jgi:hypothetical protein
MIHFFKAIKLLHNATPLNIEHARGLLHCWSRTYIELYGEKHLSFTFHLISKHLVDDVINHGSLISHSMFSLESVLGYLGKAIHGTRGFSKQYAKGTIGINFFTRDKNHQYFIHF